MPLFRFIRRALPEEATIDKGPDNKRVIEYHSFALSEGRLRSKP